MINSDNIKVLISAEEINNGISSLADKVNACYKNDEVSLLCVLKGAVMFTTDLAKKLYMPVKMEFLTLSSYGSGTTTSGEVKVVDMKLPDLNNKNVLIIDDIIDTGITAKFIMDYIKNTYNTKTLKFCSLLNKKSRRQVDIEPDFYVFDIEDKYVVGFGMDVDGNYRNLPYVGYIN